MIQVFKCPSCGASLSLDERPEPTITCQFCGSTVVVPEELRAQPASRPTPAPFDSSGLVPGLHLNKLAQLKQLALGGQKAEAIQLFRELFPSVGLAEAQEAVDKLATGQPLVLTGITVQTPGYSPADPTRLVDVMDLAHSGQTIEAIKRYREIFGVGLKEAKDAVDAMGTGTGQPVPVAQARRAVRRAGCVTTGLVLLFVVGIVAFVLAMVFGVPFRMSGSYPQALEAAQSDPAVVEALGAPVEADWGIMSGSLSCGGGSCSANYRIPIHGSKKSGYIVVFSDSRGATLFNEGTWILDATVIVNDGASLELTPVPTPTPTISAAQIDATAGAEARATRQAQAALDADATATAQAIQEATATAGAQATEEAIANATATAEAQATATAVGLILDSQQTWRVRFSDPFDDNRNGWHTGDIKESSLTAKRRIAKGQYVWNITSQHDIFWSTWPDRGKTFGDFYASVEGQVLKGGAVPSYGLVFRLGDENDFYYFGINDDGNYRFDVYEGGQTTGLPIVYGTDAIHAGGVNRLAVSASGPHFILLVNDQVVGVFDDDLFASGAIGLGMTAYEQGGEASVAFDNFEVRALK